MLVKMWKDQNSHTLFTEYEMIQSLGKSFGGPIMNDLIALPFHSQLFALT